MPGGSGTFASFYNNNNTAWSDAAQIRNATVIFYATDVTGGAGLYSVPATGGVISRVANYLTADPTNTKLAATVETTFKGETLRGLLLNAYAFGTMGDIAGIAAITAYTGGGVLLILGGLGLWHCRRTEETDELLVKHEHITPASV